LFGVPNPAARPYSNQAPWTNPLAAAAERVSARRLRPARLGLSEVVPVTAVSDGEVKLV
jgi:hypothetical protein